jgi:biopolymer transport protein TolR
MNPHPHDGDEPITYINVIPLVDVMLVLLIVFMLTASFISTPSVPVSVPKAYTSEATAPASEALVLTRTGDVFFRKRKMDLETLKRELSEAAALHSDLRVVLSADAAAPHARVVELLDLARASGVKRLALGVSRP